MDAFLAILALALAGFALVRIGELRRRLERLESQRAARPRPEAAPRGWSRPEEAPAAPAAPATSAAPAPGPAAPPAPPPVLRPEPVPAAAEPRVVPAPPRKIEWERWLGVRGAAVLGGLFLAVAGVLFFQYSIEHGLITKEMRVALGSVAGVGCLVGGFYVRRRGYPLTADAITGGGAVILYAAFWSAHLLGIFPFGVSFALMVVVTVLCGFLSWRYESQLVAWLGMTGGFATPLLLSTGQDEPVGLFSYMMLLDFSFLFVANRRRWPLVAALGLLATFVIQGMWFFERMGPETLGIGIVSLGLFALLFAVLAPGISASDDDRGSERLRWLATRITALLVPFAFAACFAGRADVGFHLYPLVLLSAMLAAAASWLSRRQGAPQVPIGAAAGGGAIALVWVLSNRLEPGRAWELAACAVLFCGVLHVFCELRRSVAAENAKGHDAALTVAASGMGAALFAAAFRTAGADVWPLLAGFALLPLFVLRIDAFAPSRVRPHLACFPACISIAVWMNQHAWEPRFAGPVQAFLAAVAAPILFLSVAAIRRDPPARERTFAASAFACLPLFTVFAMRTDPGRQVRLLEVLGLGLCALIGSAGGRSGLALGLAALATALAQATVVENAAHADPQVLRECAVILLASPALFVLWPSIGPAIWRRSRTIAWTAPLAAFFGCPAALATWRLAHGPHARAIPAGWFALVLLAAAGWSFRRRRASPGPIPALEVHDLALASFFVGLGLAYLLDRPGGPPSLAALAAGAALVWKLSDRAPLKYVASLSAASAAAMALNSALAERHPACPWPLLSAHGFDYFLPAAAVIGAALLVRALEVRRARPAEAELYRGGHPVHSALTGVIGLGMAILWITVEVENRFATGDVFRVEFGDLPARDLSLSIAWAVFALVLLLVGMGRRAGMLRWVSLILLLATIGKVFLLDLEDLRGLYRVGSFLGLAVSLLVVSLLYQRFVFRKETRPAG
jgi:uncharacterized membrane protein